MKDNELRGVVLRYYYDRRVDGGFQWSQADFAAIKSHGEFDWGDLYRICDQLGQHGLIDWKGLRGFGGNTVGGHGEITAYGVDVVEGSGEAPMSIKLDLSRHISVHSSSNVQVGDANVQDFSANIEGLILTIENAPGTESEKREAKSLLKKFLEHPLVTSIAGGLASSIKL